VAVAIKDPHLTVSVIKDKDGPVIVNIDVCNPPKRYGRPSYREVQNRPIHAADPSSEEISPW